MQARIVGTGATLGLVIAIWGMIAIDDDLTMIIFFPSVIAVSFIGSYLAWALWLRRLSKGRDVARPLSGAELTLTIVLTVAIAVKAFRTPYGAVLAPAFLGLMAFAVWYYQRRATS